MLLGELPRISTVKRSLTSQKLLIHDRLGSNSQAPPDLAPHPLFEMLGDDFPGDDLSS